MVSTDVLNLVMIPMKYCEERWNISIWECEDDRKFSSRLQRCDVVAGIYCCCWFGSRRGTGLGLMRASTPVWGWMCIYLRGMSPDILAARPEQPRFLSSVDIQRQWWRCVCVGSLVPGSRVAVWWCDCVPAALCWFRPPSPHVRAMYAGKCSATVCSSAHCVGAHSAPRALQASLRRLSLRTIPLHCCQPFTRTIIIRIIILKYIVLLNDLFFFSRKKKSIYIIFMNI